MENNGEQILDLDHMTDIHMTDIPTPEPLPPQEDDAIADAEKAIRDATMKCSEEVLRLATGLLRHGQKAATRGLHLIEGAANIQAQMMALLGMRPKGRRRRGVQYSMGSSYNGAVSISNGDGYEDPETFTGDAIGETFGNKALKQIIAMFKPIMQQGGLLGIGQKKPGSEIESLTKALAEASKAGLPQDIRDALTEKLKLALTDGAQTPGSALASLPEPQPETEPPMFVCGAKEGV